MVRVMTTPDARHAMRDALATAGVDLATASRALGYNHAYLQQFVRTGKPEWLHEPDRLRLAELYNIDVEALKRPARASLDKGRPAITPGGPPRIGDPIEDAYEAAIIGVWRSLPKEAKNLVIGALNGLLRAAGLPSIAI
jgi:hypothetical protein